MPGGGMPIGAPRPGGMPIGGPIGGLMPGGGPIMPEKNVKQQGPVQHLINMKKKLFKTQNPTLHLCVILSSE